MLNGENSYRYASNSDDLREGDGEEADLLTEHHYPTVSFHYDDDSIPDDRGNYVDDDVPSENDGNHEINYGARVNAGDDEEDTTEIERVENERSDIGGRNLFSKEQCEILVGMWAEYHR